MLVEANLMPHPTLYIPSLQVWRCGRRTLDSNVHTACSCVALHRLTLIPLLSDVQPRKEELRDLHKAPGGL